MNVIERWKEIINEIKTKTRSEPRLDGGFKNYYNKREEVAALLVIAEVLQGLSEEE